jgi:hypothetical protein
MRHDAKGSVLCNYEVAVRVQELCGRAIPINSAFAQAGRSTAVRRTVFRRKVERFLRARFHSTTDEDWYEEKADFLTRWAVSHGLHKLDAPPDMTLRPEDLLTAHELPVVLKSQVNALDALNLPAYLSALKMHAVMDVPDGTFVDHLAVKWAAHHKATTTVGVRLIKACKKSLILNDKGHSLIMFYLTTGDTDMFHVLLRFLDPEPLRLLASGLKDWVSNIDVPVDDSVLHLAYQCIELAL